MNKLPLKCIITFTNIRNTCDKNALYFFKAANKSLPYAYCEDCFNKRKSVIEKWDFIKITKKEYVTIQKTNILK